MITKMFENNLKKMNQELLKIHEFVKHEHQAVEKKIKEKVVKLMEDKVRVDEV